MSMGVQGRRGMSSPGRSRWSTSPERVVVAWELGAAAVRAARATTATAAKGAKTGGGTSGSGGEKGWRRVRRRRWRVRRGGERTQRSGMSRGARREIRVFLPCFGYESPSGDGRIRLLSGRVQRLSRAAHGSSRGTGDDDVGRPDVRLHPRRFRRGRGRGRTARRRGHAENSALLLPSSSVSYLHATVNRNKRSVTLDLRQPEGERRSFFGSHKTPTSLSRTSGRGRWRNGKSGTATWSGESRTSSSFR